MAGNATPQFTRQGNVGFTKVTAANVKSDGTGTIGTDMFKLFTADVTNGSFVDFVRVNVTGTTASTASQATVARIFYSLTGSNGAALVGGVDTTLVMEQQLPSQTTDAPTTAINSVDIPLGIRLAAGTFLLATTHNAPAAATQHEFTAYGGDY